MIQRSLSFSHISVIDYGVNNSNELGNYWWMLGRGGKANLTRLFNLNRGCFLLEGIPQYFGPLETNTDIGILAGHSLFITEKENVQKKSGHYVLKKASSVGNRSTASRLFTSASTEESCETSEHAKTATTKHTKQRWSLQLFGVKVGKLPLN
jgi:hypothetical protein